MDEVNPLLQLLQQIAGNGTAAALPVVARDPKLKSAPGADLHTPAANPKSALVADLEPTDVLVKAPKPAQRAFKIPQSFRWKEK